MVDIDVLFLASYENARKKLGRAEFTSDLASTDDERRRVVSKPKRFLSDSESDEGSPPKRKKVAKKLSESRVAFPEVPQQFPAPCKPGVYDPFGLFWGIGADELWAQNRP